MAILLGVGYFFEIWLKRAAVLELVFEVEEGLEVEEDERERAKRGIAAISMGGAEERWRWVGSDKMRVAMAADGSQQETHSS